MVFNSPEPFIGIQALLIPALLVGLLLFGCIFYFYLIIRSREKLYISFLGFSLTALVYVILELVTVFVQLESVPPDYSFQIIYFKQFALNFILISLPLYLRYQFQAGFTDRYIPDSQGSLNSTKPINEQVALVDTSMPQSSRTRSRGFSTLDSLNKVIVWIGAVIVSLIVLFSLIEKDLFITKRIFAFDESGLLVDADVDLSFQYFVAQIPGVLHIVRDIFLVVVSMHTLVGLIILLRKGGALNYSILVLVGFSIFTITMVYDIARLYSPINQWEALLSNTYLLTFGFTFAVVATSFSVLRRFFNQAKKVETVVGQLAFLSNHDALTGLLNRRAFYSQLDKIITNLEDNSDKSKAILFLDVDYFKNVNDSIGNEIGNRILIEIAGRLSSALRETDNLFRIGSDEFAIILRNLSSELDAALVSEKLLGCFESAFEVEGQVVYLTTSIGIAFVPKDGDTIEIVTAKADQALQEAKIDRNTYRFYTPNMEERSVSKIQFINYLRQSIDRREMSLHYQPQVDQDGKVIGAEALLRWQHPILGSVSPSEFIPIAEETGLIIPIGTWVIEKACEVLARWHEDGLNISLSINLSPKQLKDFKLQKTIITNLKKNNLSPSFLHLEITENSLIENTESLLGRLQVLSDLGFRFSIDDFGTGYSSLSYLKRLPIATVKIDRSFVMELPFNQQDSALVQAIIAMVQGLGLNVVAEGVDSREQLDFLLKHKCDVIQGYYFSKPLNAGEFINFTKSHKAS